MLKRPSTRRRSGNQIITLNLVPILDTMVALIAFLLFTMSFLTIVHIESPFPQASAKDVEQKLKEKPLQLTVTLRPTETELWSPFELVKPKTIANIQGTQPDLKTLHDSLIAIKQQFPKETQIVIVPYAGANYDTLISVMDTLRGIEPTDPPMYSKNEVTGNDEVIKALFPEIIFGNLLGDT